jgi:hypothetical protein
MNEIKEEMLLHTTLKTAEVVGGLMNKVNYMINQLKTIIAEAVDKGDLAIVREAIGHFGELQEVYRYLGSFSVGFDQIRGFINSWGQEDKDEEDLGLTSLFG